MLAIEIGKLAKPLLIYILIIKQVDNSVAMNINATNIFQNSALPKYASNRRQGSGTAEQPDNSSQKPRLSDAELRKIGKLKARDREVRAHEAAHVAVGGSVVRSGARLSYAKGPDGVQYATGGEVSIDTSKANSPEATVAKAERIRRAALAPAQPSAQDRAIAAQASRMEMQARQEIFSQQRSEEQTTPSISKGINSYKNASALETASSTEIDELI